MILNDTTSSATSFKAHCGHAFVYLHCTVKSMLRGMNTLSRKEGYGMGSCQNVFFQERRSLLMEARCLMLLVAYFSQGMCIIYGTEGIRLSCDRSCSALVRDNALHISSILKLAFKKTVVAKVQTRLRMIEMI